MQEESSSHPSSGSEGQAARGEPVRSSAVPHTSADQHEYLRERAEALNRPSAFDERAVARVPLEGAVQDEDVLNDLVEDALTPGPELDDEAVSPRFMAGRRKGCSVKGKKLVKPEDAGRPTLTAQQRLLLLDTWRRSGLPAGDFATLVKIGKHSLYAFVQMDPPLVLKSDNEFDSGDLLRFGDDQRHARSQLAALLNDYRVTPLLSPPYFPRYNGSIEAGIGAFKTRVHLEAARHGHPLEWNCNDVESARLQANAESRPWGFTQDTPDSAWHKRATILPTDRHAFRHSVDLYQQEVRQEKQQQLLEGLPLGPRDIASARRVAICRALVNHGLLSIRRKRFTLPFKYKSA